MSVMFRGRILINNAQTQSADYTLYIHYSEDPHVTLQTVVSPD